MRRLEWVGLVGGVLAACGVVLAACGDDVVGGTPDDAGPNDAGIADRSTIDVQTSVEAAADAPVDVADVSTPDAPSDGGADGPAPECDRTKDFEAPLAVAGIDTLTRVSLSPDELTAYVAVNRSSAATYNDVKVATRPTKTSAFTVVNTPVLGAPHASFSIWVSTDGRRLYASAVSEGTPGRDSILTASRADAATSTAFGAVTYRAITIDNDYDLSATLRDDELEIYIEHVGIAGGIYRSVRSTTGVAFPAPTVVAGLTGSTPTLSADGLELFTTEGTAARPMSVRKRASTTAAFGTPALLTNINAAGGGHPQWLSKDNCRLYLYGGNPAMLRMATRPK